MAKTILLASILVCSTLLLLGAGAELQPAPGHIVVFNQLRPTDEGGCTGTVTFAYGYLASQPAREFTSNIVGTSCTVEITEVEFPSVTFAPVGPVYVMARGYAPQPGSSPYPELIQETKFNYAVPGACPPNFQAETHTVREMDSSIPWHAASACTQVSGIEASNHGTVSMQLKEIADSTHTDCDIEIVNSWGEITQSCKIGPIPGALTGVGSSPQTLGQVAMDAIESFLA